MTQAAKTRMENAVNMGLTCVEQRIEDKATVKHQLLTTMQQLISDAEAPAGSFEELPLEVFELLHEGLGIDFETNDGRLSGLCVPTGWNNNITVCVPLMAAAKGA